jgi:uncharacterized protein YecT (DUF1311 family)
MRIARVVGWIAFVLSPICAGRSMAQHMNAKDSPCLNAGNDPVMENCLERARNKEDAELNQLYADIRRKLQSADQERLPVAQRLWVQFRDRECDAESGLYEGGSARPLVFVACMESETRHRIKDLHDGYDWIAAK